MKALVRWAIQNSPAMNTMLIATLLIGSVSLIVMRREIFPEFELEILLVSVPFPGASPEETEKNICEKIESAVKDVSGIKRMTSVAQEGSGFVILELNNNVRDVQKVLNEVDAQVRGIPSFPPGNAENVEIRQIVFKAPAINVGIVGPENTGSDSVTDEIQLRELTEQIRDDILELPPVPPQGIRSWFAGFLAAPDRPAISTADIVAAREYEIDVEIPEENLRSYRLTLDRVAQIIRAQNTELPAGKMETASQELLLRGKNRRELGKEIENIVVRSQPNGEVVTLKDIGEVKDAFADTTSLHRINGKPGMVITVMRTSDEDMLTVVDTVKEYVKNKKMPEGYELKVWQDLSVDVRDRIDLLTRNGLQGLILVFIVLAIFLDMRLAFWVALGIPVSILGAGFVLLLFGQTMNMLSMFAFLMALGIVVDDAIVIGENIYSKRSAGMNYITAAIEGTYEVLPSVCASVTTTIIAFLPLMFITGVMGKFIAVMPVAVIAMLVISLIESIFILPSHLAHEQNLFMRVLGGGLYIFKFLLIPFRWINSLADRGMQITIDKFYSPLLRFAIGNKIVIISSAISFLLLSVGFVIAGIVPFEAFPKLDGQKISGTIVYPDGTSAEFAQKATIELEEALYRVDEKIKQKYGKSVVNVVYRRVGEVGGGTGNPTGVTNGSHVGTVEVELVTTENREVTSDEINSMWRNEFPEQPGTDAVKFGSQSMGPGGNQIEFRLMANNESSNYLAEATEECKNYLGTKLGVTDIEDDSREGKTEMILTLNDLGHSLGLTEDELYRTVRSSYFGQEVDRLPRGKHEVKLMVRYPDEERKSYSNFQEIRIRDDQGNERPLTSVANIEYKRALAEINRLNQKRSITITADVDKQTGAVASEIVSEMKTKFIPELLQRYKSEKGATLYVNWEGQAQQTQESFTSMFVGFIIAMFCMYILLTLEFKSYLQPAIILFTIPFGCVGAILGHWIMSLDMTLFSFFGLIALTGVVVNDSIVLVDFINHRIRDGASIDRALIDAGRRRFRPVMLTSMTTIAGLFPILLETSLQAQVLVPMAASLVFGLATGTLFILVMVPVFYRLYWLFSGQQNKTARLDARSKARSAAPLVVAHIAE